MTLNPHQCHGFEKHIVKEGLNCLIKVFWIVYHNIEEIGSITNLKGAGTVFNMR